MLECNLVSIAGCMDKFGSTKFIQCAICYFQFVPLLRGNLLSEDFEQNINSTVKLDPNSFTSGINSILFFFH